MDTPQPDRALSPVIGVTILVAIVVVLAAGVGAIVLGFGEDLTSTDPDAVAATDTDAPAEATPTPAAAEQEALVSSRNNTAGANGTRNVAVFDVSVGSNTAGNSLNSIELDYNHTSGFVVSNDTLDAVLVAGLDTDGDDETETNLSTDLSGVTVSDNGTTVSVNFVGNYGVNENDTLVLEFNGVDNPTTAGEYTVSVTVNGEVTRNATMEIVAADARDLAVPGQRSRASASASRNSLASSVARSRSAASAYTRTTGSVPEGRASTHASP